MKSVNHSIEIETKDKVEFFNITKEIKNFVEKSGVKTGQITVFANHATSAIFVNEDEKFLLEDFKDFLNEIVKDKKFKHDNILERKDCPEDEPINGHAHILSTFYLQPSISLIVNDGKLELGKWQSVFFIELDGPCPREHKDKRKIMVNIIGE